MQPRTVLILGANGRCGLAAAQAFAAAGWQVLAQTRRPLAADMPASARLVQVALGDTEPLARAAAGASVVVYAVNPIYTRWHEELLPMARQGMDVAQRLGATFMLPGNVYSFGEQMPARLREGTQERPSTDKGRLRHELEVEMAARAPHGMRSVVLRAGDFFGAGTGNWMDLVILKSLAAGKLVYPGPPDVTHAWAYLPDFARCFVALASTEGLPPAARFHFPGQALSGHELLDAIESVAIEMGLAPAAGLRRGQLPWALIRAVAWANPMWRELVKMSYLWRVPHALDGALLAQALPPSAGGVPATPLRDALRASLLALGHQPARLAPPASAVATPAR